MFGLASENNIKVMLDGQGSDEQLCGYQRFFGCRYVYLLESLNFPTLINEIRKGKELQGLSIAQSLTMMGFYLTPPLLRQKFKNLIVKGRVPPSMLYTERLGGSVDHIKQFKFT